jgi:hypothetical protein
MAKPGPKAKRENLDLVKIEELAERGLTEHDIADYFEYSPTWWVQLKQEIPAIQEAIRRGRIKDKESKLTFLSDFYKDVKMPPNIRFEALKTGLRWLHNFRDNPSLELTGPGGTPLQVEHAIIAPEERKLKLQELKQLEECDDGEES